MKHYIEGPDSTVTHDGHLYQLDKIFKMVHDEKIIPVKVKDLTWMIDQTVRQESDFVSRMHAADLDYPIILTPWNNKWVVLDGYHRLAKAVFIGASTINAKVIRERNLRKALIPKT